MEGILEKFCKEVMADFKAKEPTENLLRIKQEQLEMQSHTINNEQRKNFTNHIKQQTLNQAIFKNWEQRCLNEMDKVREYIVENCQRRLSDYYKHKKTDAKWKDELQKSKIELNDKAKLIAYELLLKKKIDSTPEFTDQEIEDNDNFGSHLQREFRIEWIKNSHVEFIGNVFYKLYKEHFSERNAFLKNMEDLINKVEQRLLREVTQTTNYGGLIRMQFQPNSIIFDCGTLVRLYLAKATDILIQTHNQSNQGDIYNLTDTFKLMFLFFAAQIAIPNFEKHNKAL